MPREHGAWAVLIAPLLVGLSAAGGGPPRTVLLLFLAALGAFLLRPALQSALAGPISIRAFARAGVCAGLALLCLSLLTLVCARGRLWLFVLPAGVLLMLNLSWSRSRRAFSWLNEIAGIAVLCLGAPAAFYAASGRLDARAWLAWSACVLYFVGPVFFVKLAGLQHRAAAGGIPATALRRLSRAALGYHAAALGAVAAAVWTGGMSALTFLPFVAALFKTRRQIRKGPVRMDFRRLGYQEVGYACFFVAVLALAWRG